MLKKFLLLTLTLTLVSSAFAGGTARWNPIFQRWEYTGDNGYNQTSQWNSIFQRYDTQDSYGNRGSIKWNPIFQRWDYSN